jgi:hypothetical protein
VSRGDEPGVAPADARPRRAWSTSKKLLAYLVLLILAAGSIWLIDRRVDVLADRPAGATR